MDANAFGRATEDGIGSAARSSRRDTEATISTTIDPQRVFQAAWEDSRYTQIELPPTDINRRLSDRYTTAPPVTFTLEMLWDAEVRKAWRPDVYVPSEFSEAETWDACLQSDGTECFLRSTLQLLWLERAEYGRVLEQTHLDHRHRKVTFIGTAQLEDRDGGLLRAGQHQPIFYVEHSVGGDQAQPLSMWRVVHLTNGPDERIIHAFAEFSKSPWLDEFVETYIERDLGARLQRRDGSGLVGTGMDLALEAGRGASLGLACS